MNCNCFFQYSQILKYQMRISQFRFLLTEALFQAGQDALVTYLHFRYTVIAFYLNLPIVRLKPN